MSLRPRDAKDAATVPAIGAITGKSNSRRDPWICVATAGGLALLPCWPDRLESLQVGSEIVAMPGDSYGRAVIGKSLRSSWLVADQGTPQARILIAKARLIFGENLEPFNAERILDHLQRRAMFAGSVLQIPGHEQTIEGDIVAVYAGLQEAPALTDSQFRTIYEIVDADENRWAISTNDVHYGYADSSLMADVRIPQGMRNGTDADKLLSMHPYIQCRLDRNIPGNTHEERAEFWERRAQEDWETRPIRVTQRQR